MLAQRLDRDTTPRGPGEQVRSATRSHFPGDSAVRRRGEHGRACWESACTAVSSRLRPKKRLRTRKFVVACFALCFVVVAYHDWKSLPGRSVAQGIDTIYPGDWTTTPREFVYDGILGHKIRVPAIGTADFEKVDRAVLSILPLTIGVCTAGILLGILVACAFTNKRRRLRLSSRRSAAASAPMVTAGARVVLRPTRR